jgi:acetyl esterase/lipase
LKRILSMVRWFLLFLAVALLSLGLLTVVESPVWSAWQLAVLAGEFGHWFAPIAIVTAIAAWFLRRGRRLRSMMTLVTSLAAAVLLLKPAVQAWRIASNLRAKLAGQLGETRVTREPFSFATLFFGRDPPLVPIQTLTAGNGLPLDFYRPAGDADKRGAPCVIVIHGGGWNSGDRHQIPKLNHWLASRGYAVAAISYRLAPKFLWPAPRDDVLSAIAFLKAHAAELGIDAERFVLLGRSAGGQIAETVGYTANDSAIRGVIGFYAPSDLEFGYANTTENDMIRSPALMRQYLGGPPELARANYDSASAYFYVTKQTPPTLLLHGELDPLVWHRHNVRLDARLAENGVRRVFVSLPWATHAFDFNLHGPGGQLTTYAIEWFLKSVTK